MPEYSRCHRGGEERKKEGGGRKERERKKGGRTMRTATSLKRNGTIFLVQELARDSRQRENSRKEKRGEGGKKKEGGKDSILS